MRILWIAALITFSVSILSFGILYFKRSELYALTEVVPATYGELYPLSDTTLSIQGFEIFPGPKILPHFVNTGSCKTWELTTSFDDSKRLIELPHKFALKKGEHDYVLTPVNCKISSPDINAVHLVMYFGKAEDFGPMNLSVDQFQISQSNIPVTMHSTIRMDDVVPNMQQGDDEAKRALSLLNEAGFNNDASTREKIAFLVRFVREHMPRGTPPEYINTVSPYRVITETYPKGREGNFCRQFSLGYGYLANLVGIPTRNLFTGGAIQNVDMDSHAFSESYIAEEAKWAMVDPTAHSAYIVSPDDTVLNAAELYLATVTGNTGNLRSFDVSGATDEYVLVSEIFGGGSPSFFHKNNFVIYIGNIDSLYQFQGDFVSTNLRKAKRFLFQPKQYFGQTQFKSYHWLRPASFFLSTISGLLFLAFLIADIRKRA